MQYNFDVLCCTKQGEQTCVTTDYVSGVPLAEHINISPNVSKQQLFLWFEQIVQQTNQFNNVNYSDFQVTPFHLIRTSDEKIHILDSKAQVNQKYLKQIKINPLFLKFSSDHSTSIGQTFQFLLAKTKSIPQLTKQEERKLRKLISKKDRSISDIPRSTKKNDKRTVLWILMLIISVFMLLPKQVEAPQGTVTFNATTEKRIDEIRYICQMKTMTKESKAKMLSNLLERNPEIATMKRFELLQREYGFHMEGGSVWFER